jgi:hypothetical protein
MSACSKKPCRTFFSGSRFGNFGTRTITSGTASLLAERPNLRFIHWGNYERTKIESYLERFPDPTGTAARVLELLVDLLLVVRKSVVLPLPSYGLKVVEKYVGFERRLAEYQGSLAMARYIEACETSDPAAREAIMSSVYHRHLVAGVAEWQTQGTQNPAPSTCGFSSKHAENTVWHWCLCAPRELRLVPFGIVDSRGYPSREATPEATPRAPPELHHFPLATSFWNFGFLRSGSKLGSILSQPGER